MYKAAIKNYGNWFLTTEDEAILARSDDEIIFVDCVEALAVELEERYPNDKGEEFSCVRVMNDRAVEVSATPKVKKNDLNRLMELAREHGSVETWDYFNYNLDGLREVGFIADSGRKLTYDPEECKRLILKERAAERRRDKSAYVYLDHIRSCAYSFQKALRCKGIPAHCFEMTSRDFSIKALASVVATFNVVFKKELGRKPFRKFAPLQEFVKKWRRRKVKSGQVYRAAGFGSFADWMDALASGRLPKAVVVQLKTQENEPVVFAL